MMSLEEHHYSDIIYSAGRLGLRPWVAGRLIFLRFVFSQNKNRPCAHIARRRSWLV